MHFKCSDCRCVGSFELVRWTEVENVSTGSLLRYKRLNATYSVQALGLKPITNVRHKMLILFISIFRTTNPFD